MVAYLLLCGVLGVLLLLYCVNVID